MEDHVLVEATKSCLGQVNTEPVNQQNSKKCECYICVFLRHLLYIPALIANNGCFFHGVP